MTSVRTPREGYIDTKKTAGKSRQPVLSRKFLVTFFYPRRLIAELIVSLATDRASFIYGAKVAVDGGRYLNNNCQEQLGD